ncbi:MAG: ribosomal protein S18-alanine N-acetyltransferase [Gemmatimonadota bacterium]|nr:ribosomal protein S18-alanine N-acetyltransferase [Gemmatimonadota bacterium]
MTRTDVSDVVAIEKEAFNTPWKADTFEGLVGRDGLVLLVLEDPEAGILGYAVLWCILDQGELANIAIRPDLRGCGLGSRLLDHVVDACRERGVTSLYLEVRDSNAAALTLYERSGFREVGRRRGYYREPREDARVMELVIA